MKLDELRKYSDLRELFHKLNEIEEYSNLLNEVEKCVIKECRKRVKESLDDFIALNF